ncbi:MULTISPECIES: hypothetical protein [Salinimonas]|uniref:Uncharacterized protein n=2 Tax=Salinimonas TaxID=288793 RepID=A0A5B7YIA3_9ALTE|nr:MULTISPECIES: hypothetical protein [Salinimonas]MBD3587241.1 hypothetical protein [Salinimonas profundi]QCZ95294.1 hypothetical protein FBQ74_17245 [Salinimonas iocasae]
MQKIKSLVDDIGSQVYQPQLDDSLGDPKTKTVVHQYATEVTKNRIVVNYIVVALLQGSINNKDAMALVERASTYEGLNDVYSSLIEKVSQIILKPDECRQFKVTTIQSH